MPLNTPNLPGASPKKELDASVFILRAWHAIRKRWILAAALASVVTLGVAFVTLGRTKIYQVSASILIDPNVARPLGKDVQGAVDVGSGVYWTNKEYYETQFQLMRSRKIAAETVRTLGLNRDAAFLAQKPASDHLAPRQVEVEVAADILLSRLSIEPVKGTRLVSVSLEDADPERASRVLSTHVDIYVRRNIDDALEMTGTAADWMKDQLAKLKQELDVNELALLDFKRDKNILSVSLNDQSNMLSEEMKQLNEELTRVRVDRERISARVTELNKIDASDPENLPASELLADGVLAGLRTGYVETKRARDALLASGKGPAHPEVAGAQAGLDTQREALMAEVRNVQGALRRDLEVATKQTAGLSTLFEAAKQRAMDLSLLEVEYNHLDRSKNNTERLFSLVLERSKDSDLTLQMRFNNIRVVDRPLIPKAPIKPNVPLSLAAGLLSGVLLGLGAAVGRELLERTLKSPDEVAELGITYLGVLPRVQGEGSRSTYGRRRRPAAEPGKPIEWPELVVHRSPASGCAEAARAVRTNILFMSPDEPQKCILVTSAVPAEGKTTVACAVGIAMAQAGQRVLIADCDLRRPRLHRVFGVSNSVGVATSLIDPSSLDEALRPTEVPNLTVLPSGPIPPTPAEFLQSAAFQRLLDELKSRFDIIVLDSPPLVPVTDAAILATRVSGVLLVARPFSTRKDLATAAVRVLRNVGAPILGCILNDLDLDRRDYGYYSGYYAYNREGYGSTPSS